MKKRLSYLLFSLLFPFTTLCLAQTYKYIGVEDGLSNRRVYAIQKDSMGYMWFLTHDGVDRYDGRSFRHYKLMDSNEEINSMINLNWLYTDADGNLWEMGKMGRVFRYDPQYDRFRLEYKLPTDSLAGRNTPVTFSFIDSNGIIWLCNEKDICLYNTRTRKVKNISNPFKENIINIAQTAHDTFFIGTDMGVRRAELTEQGLKHTPRQQLDSLAVQVNELYYHRPSHKLFIGTFQRGMFVYELPSKQMSHLHTGLMDVSINRIRPFGEKEILIATNGAGVYKVDVNSCQSSPYIVADYNRPNGMNGNTINDLYIDGERIWMANYPIGITVRNNLYTDYQWIRHSIGNPQSLVNDQVNAIIEDSDGDLWFATNNGISLYRSKADKWHSYLSVFDIGSHVNNSIFVSLCEVSPGIIWAGGYNSGIYQIDKKRNSVEFFNPSLFSGLNNRPDKYIRSIMKASDGKIWSGGYYNLKEIDYLDGSIRYFPGVNGITTLIEKDSEHIWVGTATGLYLLDKRSGEFHSIAIPVESHYIYSLCQTEDGTLYIGTNNSGLLIYDTRKETFKHFHKDNCSLVSNNIYSIVSDGDKSLFLSTESGLTRFIPQEGKFLNWTKEQGLNSVHFNSTSGTLRKNGDFVFGSTEGAVEFTKNMTLPREYDFKMIFSNLKVFYQTVYPKTKDSPLDADINKTETLRLKYGQNIFSMQVSSINYDYPSLVLYSWKLEGFYDGWSEPERENTISFTNLSPGTYTLRVRAISSEDLRVVLQERSMNIVVEQPFWLSLWAILLYILLGIGALSTTLRLYLMRKRRQESEEKIRFFINTAHDIRTPLTLIKTPLEELSDKEPLSENGMNNIHIALRNVNALLRLTTNLINFERADTYSSALYMSEYELNTYLHEVIEVFSQYAVTRNLQLNYESSFNYLSVFIDKEKMDSILKNIISNALKYTLDGGSVCVSAKEEKDTWSIEVKDTGIGIPEAEQKKLFKMHFRGSNAVNLKVTGSGIGLMLVWRLVHQHKGKLTFSSKEGVGSVVKVTFPKGRKAYRNAMQRQLPDKVSYSESGVPTSFEYDMPSTVAKQENRTKAEKDPHEEERKQKLLIVEDNDELRQYLSETLAEDYRIQVCGNGKQALNVVKEYFPDLIVSDIMMPEMGGDALCRTLKNDIETSHIPVILLTALSTDKNVIDGLNTGADDYIVKPFNIGILRATIASLLANRALLRRKYANAAINDDRSTTGSSDESGNGCLNCTNDLDWKFITTIKQHVNDNLDNQDFNVDTLCSLLNMSRTSFYNKLKALTDQAPADYIRLIRLQHAARLLKEQRHSIIEIAEMTGFNDAKYFREVFKKYFKMSPSQYAKENSNG